MTADFRAAVKDLAEPSELPAGWTWEPWFESWPYGSLLPHYVAIILAGIPFMLGTANVQIDIYVEDLERNPTASARYELSRHMIESAVASLQDLIEPRNATP